MKKENEHFKYLIDILMETIKSRDVEINARAEEIEGLQKLTQAAKKSVSAFSSRFMTSVKFKAPEVTDEPHAVCCLFNDQHYNKSFYYGYSVLPSSEVVGYKTKDGL